MITLACNKWLKNIAVMRIERFSISYNILSVDLIKGPAQKLVLFLVH